MRNTGALKQVYESPARKQPSPNPKIQAMKRRLNEKKVDTSSVRDRFTSTKRTIGG